VSDKIKTGADGENMAARFLESKGYHVRARNYRCGRGEIDLIMQRDNWIIFVEVKTRSSTHYGEPEQTVSYGQARRIYAAAENYIFATNWKGHVRFDVVAITLGTGIVHFEDAINF
jgi:putative endonuclease